MILNKYLAIISMAHTCINQNPAAVFLWGKTFALLILGLFELGN